MKTFITMMGGRLLSSILCNGIGCRTASQTAERGKASSFARIITARATRDSSCFSRATGIPTEYACSANGG